MRVRSRAFLAALIGGVLVLTSLGGSPAQAAAGTIKCTISPAQPVQTRMDTRVSGKITCTHSKKLAVTYALVPYVLNRYGPFNGVAAVGAVAGAFNYTPGFYPPDPVTGKRDRLPDYTGSDSFVVRAKAKDGAVTDYKVNIRVVAPPHKCDSKFVADTRTMFNNPAGGEGQQYQMLRHLIKLIDCTPTLNPDGSRASIRFSFYSLTYAPVQAALTAAAKRGVAVQALTNSHADKYAAWQELARSLGGNTRARNFASTCWQGCLTPRTPPAAGGPTAWYSAEAKSLTSKTVVFRNRSIASPGAKIVSYRWTFGDGTKASGKGPHTKKYRKYGTYKTTLTVTDAKGRKHTTVGEKTLPDELEPEYPSLHSKIYLFSTVGSGARARQWVTAYSSGNPTYQQSRKGFNNLNIAVGDRALYNIFYTYYGDLVKGSRGQLMTRNYFRTFSSPGNGATGARPTTVHLGPQTTGDINRDILQSIRCKYKVGKTTKRTDVKVSMFVFTRKGVAADLWRLAMHKGCNVEIVYTQMSQRIKGVRASYGAADCLSAKPTKVVRVKGKRKVVRNDVETKKGLCRTGTLKGRVPVTSSGMWVNRTSPYGGGSLKVRMSCPVAPKLDPVKKTWAVLCVRNDIFTHHKVLLVNGFIRGRAQKYVMSGSSNWSSPGLRSSDEVITEIQNAGKLYDQYRANYDTVKKIVAKNSKKSNSSSAQTFVLQLSDDQTLDVRGMTDAQLDGQA